jgi:hypothetical protein
MIIGIGIESHFCKKINQNQTKIGPLKVLEPRIGGPYNHWTLDPTPYLTYDFDHIKQSLRFARFDSYMGLTSYNPIGFDF